MKDKGLIIGITGTFGSGKSTAAEYFKSKGFAKITLSSFLEDEAKKRRIKKITRKTLQDIGNEWREKHGRGVLVKKAINYLKKNKIEKAVIDGVRNFGELEELNKKSDFALLAILANRKIRFDRLKKLNKREKLNAEIFRKLDLRDLGIGEKTTGLQVAYCIAVADIFITNDNDKKSFIEKLEKVYKAL